MIPVGPTAIEPNENVVQQSFALREIDRLARRPCGEQRRLAHHPAIVIYDQPIQIVANGDPAIEERDQVEPNRRDQGTSVGCGAEVRQPSRKAC
jgi:hypothetical protein